MPCDADLPVDRKGRPRAAGHPGRHPSPLSPRWPTLTEDARPDVRLALKAFDVASKPSRAGHFLSKVDHALRLRKANTGKDNNQAAGEAHRCNRQIDPRNDPGFLWKGKPVRLTIVAMGGCGIRRFRAWARIAKVRLVIALYGLADVCLRSDEGGFRCKADRLRRSWRLSTPQMDARDAGVRAIPPACPPVKANADDRPLARASAWGARTRARVTFTRARLLVRPSRRAGPRQISRHWTRRRRGFYWRCFEVRSPPDRSCTRPCRWAEWQLQVCALIEEIGPWRSF